MKYKNGKYNLIKKLISLLAVLMVLQVTVFLAYNYLPSMDETLENAAMLSVVLTMPEGGTQYLNERFKGDILSIAGVEALPPGIDTDVAKNEDNDEYHFSLDTLPVQNSEEDVTMKPQLPEDIEEEYRGVLVSENLSADMSSAVFEHVGVGYLRNYTSLTGEEIKAVLKTESDIRADLSGEPQVLIFHTHATESYEPFDSEFYDTRGTWRSTNNDENMVAVGDVLAQALEDAGIAVIHDTTQHDYPSYNGGYDRSAKTVSDYLAEYPSIKVVLDIHRDAIVREDDVIVKPVVEIDGRKAAQLMIISACDNEGTLGVPGWENNLRFAAALTNAIEKDSPGLMRPIFFANRKYNMNLSPGALLLEFGGHANTLEEAKYTAELAGKSIAKFLLGEE